jgi:hypothetical protein
VRIARDARRATLEITVTRNATRTRRVEVTDVARQAGLVRALKPLQDPAVTCVRRASGAKIARWNARLTQPAWITEGVLAMEVVYAHRDSLERAVTCAMLTCMGKAVTSRAHALRQGGVWRMAPANVHMDGWERRALSVVWATSAPSASRFVIPRSIAVRKEFALATEAADAWTHTAGQTAACV